MNKLMLFEAVKRPLWPVTATMLTIDSAMRGVSPSRLLKGSLKIKTMRGVSLMAVALMLGGGGLQSAGAWQVSDNSDSLQTVDAQQVSDDADADSPSRFQEPAPAPSQSSNTAAEPDWVPPSAMRIHDDQGVRYISGGVGEDELTELRALSHQFNLRLQFAMQGSGDYLSAVDVNILDAHGGTVLAAQSKGPWFFAKLEPGNYRVAASSADHVQGQPSQRTVHVHDSGQQRLDFYWR